MRKLSHGTCQARQTESPTAKVAGETLALLDVCSTNISHLEIFISCICQQRRAHRHLGSISEKTAPHSGFVAQDQAGHQALMSSPLPAPASLPSPGQGSDVYSDKASRRLCPRFPLLTACRTPRTSRAAERMRDQGCGWRLGTGTQTAPRSPFF